MDRVVFEAADGARMVYCETNLRLFTHYSDMYARVRGDDI